MIRQLAALAFLHLGVLEGVQAAGVLEGGARRDGGGTVAGEREEVARDPGAGAVSVSIRRVRSLEQVAGVQKRDPPLACTARSGVESQPDDTRVCAELGSDVQKTRGLLMWLPFKEAAH